MLYTVFPFQSYSSVFLFYTDFLYVRDMLWNHINGQSGTRTAIFQRARGHKCHSVNSQCAASMCHRRPENESASEERERERQKIQRNTARVTKSNQIDGAAHHI